MGTDNYITYVPAWGKGVARISAAGGAPTFITTVEYGRQEFAHVNPCITPDNKHVLFTVWNGAEETRIEAVEIATGKRYYNIIPGGSTPRIARTPRGHAILYERNGNLFAAAFDVEKIQATGNEVVLADGVMTDQVLFSAMYDVADDGTLAYVPGTTFIEESRLSWLQPDGTTKPFNEDRYAFGEPHFTSDGNKVSVIVKGKQYRIHVYDLKQGTFERVVTDSDVVSASISPDGRILAYSSNEEGPYNLYIKRMIDGRSQRVSDMVVNYQVQVNWSADSRYIIYSTAPKIESPRDIQYIDLNSATREPRPIVNSPADERTPRLMPNSKWLAYNSNQSGTREIYLKSFPDGQTTRQITFGGGDSPDFSPDGTILYFRAKGKLYKVNMDPETGATKDRPTLIYEKRFGQSDFELTDYTVDPRGRVLIVEPSERGPKVDRINVILNWWKMMEGGN